ncbi:hypothetical protein Q604_UNBC10936G0001, partial [human gut metagenome]
SSPSTVEKMRVEKPLLKIFKELGIKEEKDAKKLIYNLRLQHEMAGGEYKNTKSLQENDPKLYQNYKDKYEKVYG